MNRKTVFVVFGLATICLLIGAGMIKRTTHKRLPEQSNYRALQNGDLIFQTSGSSQSRAIQLATHSRYSHCGIIYIIHGKQYVYEAVQPVKLTLLNDWIARGENGHYVVKRLKNAEDVLTATTLQKMKKAGDKFLDKPYDLYFEWSDERIYCSELIWKIYREGAGIEIGKPERLADFDLQDPVVQNKLHERYGKHIPLNETVISPSTIFEADNLYTVSSN